LVGSEAEYECLAAGFMRSTLSVPGLDCAKDRFGIGVKGRAVSRLSLGVGGHSGLLTSKKGFEISLLSIEPVQEEREERDDGPRLPFNDSVSFDHEKA
jgi:hypothetical protein